MKPTKKPKYKLDPKKFNIRHLEKKDKDISEEELYQEMLRSKSRHRRR